MFLVLLLGLIVFGANGKPFDDPVCGYDSCPEPDPDALNIHIVPHSHDDVGWEKNVDEYFFEDVQNVLSSVVTALRQNPDRRFAQCETAFFKMWWERQTDSIKEELIKYVNNGQFEIVNGAWSANDEAGVHYQCTIDQYTLGLRYLSDTLGPCSKPTVAWQVDAFGHSREQVSINAQMGFDSFYFARLDYRDKDNRLNTKTADLISRGSSNLGNSSDLFTSVLYNHYSAPPGFCFDIKCNDAPIIDDEESPDYNYQKRVEDFANYVRDQADHYATNQLLVVMGDDFRYQAALNTYINVDRLIEGFNKFPQTYNDKAIKLFYSSPSCYAKAVNDFAWDNDLELQIKTDDFFPYSDGVAKVVVGYFTSRPASKRFVREGNTILQVAKQLAANARDSYENEKITSLKEAMGILQHHDAITGTEHQEVADDYHRYLHSGIVDATESASSVLTNLISGDDGDDFEFKSCLLSNMSSCAQAQGDKFTIAVYNPLSRAVNAPINLPVNGDSWTIVDPDGNDLSYQVTDPITDFNYVDDVPISPNILEFVAQDIPALGYKVYQVQKSSKKLPPLKKPRAKIGFDDTSFEIDDNTGLLTFVTMNNITLDVSQDFLYYKSDGASQTWIFKPNGDPPKRLAGDKVTVTDISGDVFQGIRQDFSDIAKQTIKVYNDDRSYVEFDWVIGPLSIDDGGREIISKFATYLKSEGVFYTDSNGREMLKRVRDFRPDFEYTDEQPIAGNYYPITSKIVIRDEGNSVELAVLTDRSQGGGSIDDGQVELMVHRACNNDVFGLNEQQYGRGIIVRGRHWLVLGPTSGNGDKSIAAIERDVAMRKFLPPWVFVTDKDISGRLNTLQGSQLTRDLPENVQILTLEPWNEGVLLLRLEHTLERDEDENLSQAADVDLNGLFGNFEITELQEMALAANIKIEDKVRLGWPGSSNEKVLKPTVKADGLVVTLEPMQIRTFLATYN